MYETTSKYTNPETEAGWSVQNTVIIVTTEIASQIVEMKTSGKFPSVFCRQVPAHIRWPSSHKRMN